VSYLKNTKEYALRYEKHPHVLEGYSDVNWIADSKKSNQLADASYSWRRDRILEILQTNLHNPYFTMELKFIALDKAGEKAKG